MRIVFLGAGAIGSIAGGYLAKAGQATALIGDPPHVKKINEDGLEIVHQGGSFRVKVPAYVQAADVPWQSDDFIFLTVKSQHSEAAIEQAAKAVGGDIPICCFQNGVRNEEIAARKFKRVYGGSVLFSGTYLDSGRVYHSRGDSAGLGVYPKGSPDDLIRSAGDSFEKAGLKITYHDNIVAVKWVKLLLNTINAICAITDLSGPEALTLPDARQFVDENLEEGKRVLRAAGIEFEESAAVLPPVDLFAPLLNVPEELKHRPSTWQDLKAKRRNTEVDYLNGEIVRLGKEFGVETPLNCLMLNLVHEMTEKEELPGKYSIADLQSMLTEK